MRPRSSASLQPADRDAAVVAVVGEAVDAGLERGGVGLGVVVEVVLGVDQVGRRFGVADHEQLVAGRLGPAAQLGLDQRADVAGAAVDQVVGGHRAGGRAVGDRGPEGGQVVLVQHPGAQAGGRDAAVVLVVVGEEVLEDRGGAQELAGGRRSAPGRRRRPAGRCAPGPRSSPPRCAPSAGHAAGSPREPRPAGCWPRCRRRAGGGSGTRAVRPKRPRRPGAPAPRPRSHRAPPPGGRPWPGRASETPCRASVPVRKAPTPRRGTAGAYWCTIAIRSSSVSRSSRSSTRLRSVSAGSRKGSRSAAEAGGELTWQPFGSRRDVKRFDGRMGVSPCQLPGVLPAKRRWALAESEAL